jgi:hypothetical protein
MARKIKEFTDPITKESTWLRLDAGSYTYEAEIDGQTCHDKDAVVVTRWIESTLAARRNLTWFPILEVITERKGGFSQQCVSVGLQNWLQKVRQTKISLAINRLYACNVGEQHMVVAWDVPEARRDTKRDIAKNWTTQKLPFTQNNSDQVHHYYEYDENMYLTLITLQTHMELINERLMKMVSTADSIQELAFNLNPFNVLEFSPTESQTEQGL